MYAKYNEAVSHAIAAIQCLFVKLLQICICIQLNEVETFTAAKLKAVDDAVLPIIDEYLGLKSPLKILEKISPRPKIPVLRQRKRKTESAENLTS